MGTFDDIHVDVMHNDNRALAYGTWTEIDHDISVGIREFDCDVAVRVTLPNGIVLRLHRDGKVDFFVLEGRNLANSMVLDLVEPYSMQIQGMQMSIGVPEDRLIGNRIEKWREEHSMLNRNEVIPEKVICNPPMTIAFWADGTKTYAKTSEGTPYDPFAGISVCIVKKILPDVLDDGRSPNGEIGRLISGDRERRAKTYLKQYPMTAFESEFNQRCRELRNDWLRKNPDFSEPTKRAWQQIYRQAEEYAKRERMKFCIDMAAYDEKEWA